MTGQAELDRYGTVGMGLERPPARPPRPPVVELTQLTFRRSTLVRGGLTRQVRNLTRQQRPNSPRTVAAVIS
jgi:hypothetical protein